MAKDDRIYVGHMVDVANAATQKLRGLTRDAYERDENLRLALTHLVQTIGEAARRVSEDFRHRHSEVPRKQIIGMRHKVVHDYMEVDYDLVWDCGA